MAEHLPEFGKGKSLGYERQRFPTSWHKFGCMLCDSEESRGNTVRRILKSDWPVQRPSAMHTAAADQIFPRTKRISRQLGEEGFGGVHWRFFPAVVLPLVAGHVKGLVLCSSNSCLFRNVSDNDQI